MRVLVVGDLHADVTAAQITVDIAKRLEVNEVWQAGDLGYWPRRESPTDRHQRFFAKLDELPVNMYFADGNHEDHESLDHPRWSVAPRQISARVFHQPRGSVRAINGTRVLFFGGAYSVDADRRIEGVSWFRNEVPNHSQWQTALGAGEVDAIVTHDAASIVDFHYPPHNQAFWPQEILEKADRFRQALTTELLPSAKPTFWFSGHHHKMKLHVEDDTRFFAMGADGYRGTFAVYDLEAQFAHFVTLADNRLLALSPTAPKRYIAPRHSISR